MEYNDDFLNVYGFLRLKIIENLGKNVDLVEQIEKNQSDIEDARSGIENLKESIRLLSETYGIDIPLNQETFMNNAPSELSGQIAPVLKVDIPSDINYEKVFDLLLKEATDSGFTNVRPEDLLSETEMISVAERSDWIDQKFAEKTGLRESDIRILIIASAIKIACYYILKTADGNSLSNNNSNSDEFLTKVIEKKSINPRVLDQNSILYGPVPFDIEDNSFFKRKDILGYDPIIGWLFGVFNFMTNSVTTTNLNSYSVNNASMGKISVGEKISTPIHVILPILENLKDCKYSIIAAVVREADVLKVTHASFDTVVKLIETMQDEIDKTEEIISNGQSNNFTKNIDFSEMLKRTSVISFVDTLIAAAYSVFYDPACDGEVNFYALRMHKIILISNAFASIASSLPAIASEDLSTIDHASIINTLMGFFHTTKYWIDIKAQYLVSEHKRIIDAQLDSINKHFINVD